MKPNYNFYLTVIIVVFVLGMMAQSRMIGLNLKKAGCKKIDAES